MDSTRTIEAPLFYESPSAAEAAHVLVVEDDRDIRETLAEFLATMGYRVSVAANGLDALRCARAELPGIILLDLTMPVMSGWEFRREQLRDAAIARIPVIVTSLLGSGEHPDAASHVRKDDVRSLLDAIERLLP